MRIFNSKALDQSSKLPLTLEHCPPAELGGKPQILLCKECNNKTGHNVDIKLMEFLNVKPFNEKQPNALVRNKNSVIESEDIRVQGTTSFKRINENSFQFDLKASDKYRTSRFDQILKKSEFTITYKPHSTPDTHMVHIGLLKIAYLLAFKNFGHLFILNHNYDMVRKQILNPESRLLISKGVLRNTSLPIGFYLVNQPTAAKGILVVFELTHDGNRIKYAVILNHPNTKDIEFYFYLSKLDGKTIRIEKEDFREIDFLVNRENIGLYYDCINKNYSINLKRVGLDLIYVE